MKDDNVPICKNCKFYKWQWMSDPICIHPLSKYLAGYVDKVSGKDTRRHAFFTCKTQRQHRQHSYQQSDCGPKGTWFELK